MKQIYFVRHGESQLNKAGKWAGTTNTPLTPRGRNQAKKAGRLAKRQGLGFDLIISSPLERAHHTAQHIAAEVGYPHDKILIEPNLAERHYGDLEAKDHISIVGARNLLDETHVEKYGAEKLEDLQRRADNILAYLNEVPHKRILVVGHGASGRALWRAANKLPIHTRHKRYANAKIERLL